MSASWFDRIYTFTVSITDTSNYNVIYPGADTYQGDAKYVCAFILPPESNADTGGYCWIQAHGISCIIIRHSGISLNYGTPRIDVIAFCKDI